MESSSRGSFGTKIGAILAAAGSAVGLGNVWRFPTEVGNHGGAAFILLYLGCVFFIGVPVMVSEFVIGRHTHANVIHAFSRLAPRSWWRIEGVLGVVAAYVILGYYIVISGWTLYYLLQSLCGDLSTGQDYTVYFNDFVSNSWLPVVFAGLFMLATHLVIVRGVQRGIELCSKVMMPMLFIIIIVLVFCSFSMPGSAEGLKFLLQPDFSKVTAGVVVSAMGQAFFSLSIGMGCLCTYASYFTEKTDLVKTARSVILIDTLVAVLSGFFIFPAVFSVPGVTADAGPGLVFITLPNVFNLAFHGIPVVGYLFSGLFYLLLLLAALTSAISLHEVVTAYVLESFHLSRKKAAGIVTSTCFLLGVACSLSFGPWSKYTLGGLSVFECFDFLASKILLPVGGLIISLFVGWRLDRKLVAEEITNYGEVPFRYFRIFSFVLRWLVPLAIVLIFVNEFFSK